MNAFGRMFYEPKALKPTLSMARCVGFPLVGVGFLWLAAWTVAGWNGRELPLPWWAGLALICAGALMYAVNKFSAGPVSIELSGPNATANVTNAPDKP